MAVDGSLHFDTKIDTKGFKAGTKSINAEVKTLSGAFGKLATLAKKAFAVGILYKFSKESVKATAEVKAQNAAMQQSFRQLRGEAVKAMEEISDATNIAVGRLKPGATSIFSFAKVSGVEATEALSLTRRAMIAAADSAAYYDRSLEDTIDTLKSYLKGNFANDAALGLASTEYTRNAKAMELYGKKFIELSEAQKQFTLLGMVEDANKMSGALGQAAREGKGLENVLGNLKESARQFMAAMGEPLLNVVIPAMVKLSQIIDAVTAKIRVANAFMARVFGWEDAQQESIGGAVDEQNKLTDAVKETEKAQKGSLAGFDTIMKLSSETAKEAKEAAPVLSMKPIGGTAGTATAPQTIDKSIDIHFSPETEQRIAKLKQDFENLQQKIDVLKEPLTLSVNNGLALMNTLLEKISPAFEWFEENVLKPMSEWTFDKLEEGLEALASGLEKLNKFANGEMTFEELIEELSDLEIVILAIVSAIMIAGGLLAAFVAIKAVIAIVSGAFAILTSPITLVILAIAALIAIIVLCIKHWDKIKEAAGNAWDSIKHAFINAAGWFDEKVIQPIGKLFKFLWYGIKLGFVNFINFIIDGINFLIKGFLSPINNLIKGWNATVGRITEQIPEITIAIPTIKKPKMPKLAQGAVIPPNRRFYAELGDQTSGVNVETPLKTITDAVEDVIGRIGGGNRPMTVILELDGRELGRAVVKTGKEEVQRIGAKIPVM